MGTQSKAPYTADHEPFLHSECQVGHIHVKRLRLSLTKGESECSLPLGIWGEIWSVKCSSVYINSAHQVSPQSSACQSALLSYRPQCRQTWLNTRIRPSRHHEAKLLFVMPNSVEVPFRCLKWMSELAQFMRFLAQPDPSTNNTERFVLFQFIDWLLLGMHTPASTKYTQTCPKITQSWMISQNVQKWREKY